MFVIVIVSFLISYIYSIFRYFKQELEKERNQYRRNLLLSQIRDVEQKILDTLREERERVILLLTNIAIFTKYETFYNMSWMLFSDGDSKSEHANCIGQIETNEKKIIVN